MGKYKIFIIDDEPMVIKGLKELVPWEEINCEIAAQQKWCRRITVDCRTKRILL